MIQCTVVRNKGYGMQDTSIDASMNTDSDASGKDFQYTAFVYELHDGVYTLPMPWSM
jgi:hypothetical protein